MEHDENYFRGVVDGLEIAEKIVFESDPKKAREKLDALYEYMQKAKDIYLGDPIHAC